MKKRMLSILLCICMAISLLPMSALAADYDGWEAATAEGVTLTADTDTVTIGGVTYTYKGEADTSGVDLAPYNGGSAMALKEACCWKAGSGYVLYKPTVGSVDWRSDDVTTSAEVTLHDAEISTASAFALKLPVNSPSSTAYPVPVTVHVEGTNSLTTNNISYTALYHQLGDTTLTGGGILSIVGCLYNGGAVTIDSGTQVTVNGGDSNGVGGNLTVTGSGSKLTIASGTKLLVEGASSTVTVENGAVLENNGTLSMYNKTKDNPGITGDISGNGTFQFGDLSSQLYCLVDGKFIAYGGDVETSGLNLSGKNASGDIDATYNAPTEVTRYKACSGYILFTPATADPVANAKLELHDATISTTSGRALYLPGEALDITVTGNNSLTANGSYAIDTNEQAVNITGGGNLSLTGSNGIVPSSGDTPSITINIHGALNIKTTSNPIQNVSGDIHITAKSITIGDAYGVFCNGIASFEATDGDITLTGGSGMAAVNGNDGVSLKASGKITVDNSAGSSALNSNSGTVTVDAQGDVAIKAGGIAIWFGTGVSITSNAGSIDVTTSGYTCIEKSSGGPGGEGVELSAAKDITLNADTTAISTSEEDVYLTAGGKLSSTSKYGFQVRELTIKANEVSIEGTQQDGILATSVAITNPTGGNCKSVSVTGSGSDSYAAIRALGSADTGNITIKADDLFLCGNGSAKALSALGTVTIEGAGMIVGAISAGAKNIAAGVSYASKSGDDKSGGLNLTTPPTETTVYTADSGYVLFTPATITPAAPAKLTLHNATIHNTTAINDATGVGIALPDGAITLVVEGTNKVDAQYANAIWGTNTDVTLSGTGVLNVGYKAISLNSTAANPHSLTKGASVTLNGIVNTYDNSSESGAADTNTVYGSVTLPSGVSTSLDGAVAVTQGATMTIPQGTTLDLKHATAITNNGTLLNKGTVLLPDGTDASAIKALKLTGVGMVKTGSKTYTNDGTSVIGDGTTGLDLATGSGSGTTVEDDGYSWDGSTLTLGNAYVSGDLTLPDHAIIQTTSSSIINGDIRGAASGIEMTVQGGEQLTVNGRIDIGSSGGENGRLIVTGAGTSMNVSSSLSGAVYCENVRVENGASLTAHSEGSIGVGAMGGSVSVTGGSTLTVGCEYGVYIENGSFTVDESSTFTANASVAAVCVVDKTKTKDKSQMVSVPSSMLPSGTQIKTAVGETPTYGYTYCSIASSGMTLSASNENSEPATLAGALGTLTMKKASDNGGGSSGGSSSGGGSSASTSCTLTFETNGGSVVTSLSKTSGTVVDLNGYKPTRDGYTFAGWYSDTALTRKVTSVTLTKSMTVYAKWTEKSTNPFADVTDSAYYHDAVLWAVENSVTSGTSNTAFAPEKICTRAQMATFLWRAMGSPEPNSTDCPFTDVAPNAYYYKAVLWAVEKGITAGTSKTTFGPDNTITRGQAVTFLWRAAGSPAVTAANPFADVAQDSYYYNAVLWAVEKGITQGISSTSFRPSAPCNRAQIVTFLYRYAGE